MIFGARYGIITIIFFKELTMKKILILIIAPLIAFGMLTVASHDAVYALVKEMSSPERILDSLDADVIKTSEKSQMIEVAKEHRETVEEKLDGAGYKPLETEMIENAAYPTRVLTKLDRIVTLQETEKTLRVIWGDFDKDSLDLLMPNDATGEGEVVMAQIGVARGDATDNPMIGMCYVYRLSDGSAVIIDGGWPNEECADNLFATLVKMDIARDEDGRMKISAWIFTHGHADHIGTFHTFAEKYSDVTDISYILYNLPTEDVAPNDCNVIDFIELAKTCYPDAVHVEPRAGLKYHFDNITVDILYSPEMLYTTGETLEYYNNTSLVFTVECSGTKVLHFGDAGEAVAKALWESYREETFRADAVQITHHALNTGATSNDWEHLGYIYEATDAKVGLLPLGTRNSAEERNGRYTVLSDCSSYGFQISFVTNGDDTHGLSEISQDYYDRFIKDVENGTAAYGTLLGYDGVNTVVNEDGMVTYLSATETAETVTVFFLSQYGMNLLFNTELNLWLYHS